MNCLICRQAKTNDGFTTVILERVETQLVVKHVPARICPACGDAYVDEAVAERLLQSAEEMASSGERNETRDYESL